MTVANAIVSTMKKIKISPLIFIVTLLFVFSGANVFAGEILLNGGIIHTVSGDTITNGAVLIENGKIKQIFTKPEHSHHDAQSIDLHGLHLYPALIALDTAAG